MKMEWSRCPIYSRIENPWKAIFAKFSCIASFLPCFITFPRRDEVQRNTGCKLPLEGEVLATFLQQANSVCNHFVALLPNFGTLSFSLFYIFLFSDRNQKIRKCNRREKESVPKFPNKSHKVITGSVSVVNDCFSLCEYNWLHQGITNTPHSILPPTPLQPLYIDQWPKTIAHNHTRYIST